jgi:glycosyltransferase involved in cell wall biosynthesis
MRKTAETFEFYRLPYFGRKKDTTYFLGLWLSSSKASGSSTDFGRRRPGKLQHQTFNCRIKINDVVTLTGYLPKPEIAARMQQSHALVLASDCETFGVVLIEALAAVCR